VPIVLIDGENVRRSLWPNLTQAELARRAHDWARANGHDARVVWEGDDTADDQIAAEVRRLGGPIWVVTSDRELRTRVEDQVERVIGGGTFARMV
jgi:rRNA-processing protein FCF1